MHQLDPNCVWLLSGGASTNFAVGSRLNPVGEAGSQATQAYIKVEGPGEARIVGFPEPTRFLPDSTPILAESAGTPYEEIPYAPERPPQAETTDHRSVKYPYVRGRVPWKQLWPASRCSVNT